MPSKTPKQAKFMRAIAHGWTPSRMSSPPSRAVAQEFVNADRKYSGGFAENRYWTGGLAAMNEVTAGGKRGSLDLFKWHEGGDVDYDPYYGRGGGTNAWGLPYRYYGWRNAGNYQQDDDGGYTYVPPEVDGGGPDGPTEPPPRIIETDPASYVGAGADSSDEDSEYREQLRQHQAKITAILASARGGHVNYYEEGGAIRPDHAEDLVKGPNPHNPATEPAAYKYWESRFHKAPPPPKEVVEAAPEKVPWYMRIAGYGSKESAEDVDEVVTGAQTGQAYGGRVRYQLGGLAIAAPAGGVPPWIAPTGSGPGYMDEPPPGYQFGGIADRFSPPAAAPAVAQPYRGVPPQRGMISRGATSGGLAAMRQQARQQRGGLDAGNVVDPTTGQVAGGMPGGPGGGGLIDRLGMSGGRFGAEMRRARGMQTYQDVVNRGEGGINPRLPGGGRMYGGDGGGGVAPGNVGTLGGPGYGEYPLGSAGPRMDPSDPRYRDAPPPGSTFMPGGGGRGKPRPGPGMMPPGGGPGGPPTETTMPVGGPRVPPNMRGYLQKRRMMNRPPSGPVGGGGNRIGMADQQGALSRAMQRGTGRPPMSRRMGFGRAGPTQ